MIFCNLYFRYFIGKWSFIENRHSIKSTHRIIGITLNSYSGLTTFPANIQKLRLSHLLLANQILLGLFHTCPHWAVWAVGQACLQWYGEFAVKIQCSSWRLYTPSFPTDRYANLSGRPWFDEFFLLSSFGHKQQSFRHRHDSLDHRWNRLKRGNFFSHNLPILKIVLFQTYHIILDIDGTLRKLNVQQHQELNTSSLNF